MIKLREVYDKVYRNSRFSFFIGEKEYSTRVINVTFNYSVKEFNKLGKDTYIRNGYLARNVDFEDCACVRDGQLVGIKCGESVEHPLPPETLGKFFFVQDGKYAAKTNISSILSVADLRHELYDNGFDCDGVHYVRYKRSSGSSRVGKCLFVDEKMYSRLHRYDLCGLKVREGDKIDLAGFESYIALTSSSIIDTLQIDPRGILMIDDYDSTFRDHVVATGVRDGEVYTEYTDTDVTNSIWDGQSLMQTELFGPYAQYGFVLLRNRFFKSACFNCDIQQFFADHGITSIDQVHGKTLATRLEDIKLITTPSSIKYLKFGTFEQWLNNIEPTFGVVKHEKPTHFFGGRMVQTHYQLLNTLQLSQKEVDEFLAPSLEYVRQLRFNPAVLRWHIKYPEKQGISGTPMPTKNDIVYRLLGINEDFAKTKEYAEFRGDLVKSYMTDLRKGKVLVEGNYSTLCGNPVEMLYASIGEFDGKSRIGVGCVVSKRFAPGITLLGSRSPHITIANVWLSQNTANEEIERYFVMTDEILYINSIGENVLQRLSGSDFDSDTALITNNEQLISVARRNIDFEVPTSMIKASKANLYYTNKDKADLDIRTSVNKIGEIINLSQELNTKLWDSLNTGASKDSDEIRNLYKDIAKLDVMSGCEIDKAKKILPIDNNVELKKLKECYKNKDEKGRKIRPNFFAPLARSKGYYDTEKVNYKRFHTAMDYVQHTLNCFQYKLREYKMELLPLSSILDPSISTDTADYDKVRQVLRIVRECQSTAKDIWRDDSMPGAAKAERVAELRADCASLVGHFVISVETARALVLAIEKESNRDVRQYLFTVLFGTPNPALIDALRRSVSPIPLIVPDDHGDIVLYGRSFSQK